MCANYVEYAAFQYFPKTQDIKKPELMLEKKNKNRSWVGDCPPAGDCPLTGDSNPLMGYCPPTGSHTAV